MALASSAPLAALDRLVASSMMATPPINVMMCFIVVGLVEGFIL
jgi:hypothetical protein